VGFSYTTPLAGISVLDVSDGTAPGTGTLTAASADTVSWAAPGGTAGTAVHIGNGELALLQDGTDATDWIVVKRTTADGLSGTGSVLVTGLKTAREHLEEIETAMTAVRQEQAGSLFEAQTQRAQLATLEQSWTVWHRRYLRETGRAPAVAYPDMRLTR